MYDDLKQEVEFQNSLNGDLNLQDGKSKGYYSSYEELIEKYFPNNNIRYIAINDGIDTFIDNTNNDIAPFKAIMNDMYAKDISKKIKSSLHSRMKDGLYVSGRCPFGYQKDPNNKNHLIINEEQAEGERRLDEYLSSLE